MLKYVIDKEIPGAEKLSAEQVKVISQASCGVEKLKIIFILIPFIFLLQIQGNAQDGSHADMNGMSKHIMLNETDFQWGDALEQLGSDVAIGTKIGVVNARIHDDRAAGGLQGVEMFRQQRDHCWLRHQSESIGSDRTEEGRPVAIGEEDSFASPARLQHGGEHGTRALRKLALGRLLRAKIG